MGKKGKSSESSPEADSRDAEAVKAVKSGNLRKISDFLDKNAGLANARNKKGQTLLMIASEAAASDVVDELLSRGADATLTDNKKMTALHYAMLEEEDIIAATLVRHGAKMTAQDDAGETCFHIATRIANEASIRLTKILLTPDDFNDFFSAETPSDDEDTPTPTQTTTLRDTDVAKVIPLQDENGSTLLHLAASEPDAAELVTFYIEKLALLPPTHASKVLNAKAKNGTALAQACGVGSTAVVEELLSAGADPTILSDEGCSALHEACMDGTPDIVAKILAKSEAPLLNLQSVGDGSTALHYAALNGHTDVVALLLEQDNAALSLKDMEGETPMSIAWMNGHTGVVEMLAAKGVSKEGLSEVSKAQRAVKPTVVSEQVKEAKRVEKQKEEKEAEVAEKVHTAMEAKKNEPEGYDLNMNTLCVMVFAFFMVVGAALAVGQKLGLMEPAELPDL